MGGSNNRSRGRRLAAVLGAFTLALVGAVSASTTASAVDDYGNINTNKAGSILIHKHVHQTGTPVQASPDTATDPNFSAPVSGVVFTAYKLDLDLSTQAGWDGLPAAVPATACDDHLTLGVDLTGASTESDPTGATGQTTISYVAGQAVGAYLLCETDAPSTVVNRAQPFVVTIPFSYKRATGTAESWLYDVNVYPKNGVTSINKTVAPQTDLGLGATATFPVTTKVPKIAANENFTHYWVQDQMPSQITPKQVKEVVLGGTALTVIDDYTVTISGKLVSVEFIQAGLRKLKTAGPADLVTTYEGVVASISPDGTATNTAYVSAATKVLADAPASPDSLKSPTEYGYVGTSDSVTQTWMDLNIKKVDVGDGVTGLAGAQFEVYEAAVPYPTTTCAATPKDGGLPISVLDSATGNRRSVFTTTTGGALKIDGLFVSDTGNSVGNGQTKRCYVLKEVVPPAGFILPTDGSELTAVVVGAGVTNAVIKNTRIKGVVLPMTGSDGIVVLSIAGLVLIAAGIVLAFLARRRRQTA